MIDIALKDLTDKQCRAWKLRYLRRWRMKRIALAMGITPHAVSQLLKRAMRRAGVPWRHNARVVATKPRLVKVLSLSEVWDI